MAGMGTQLLGVFGDLHRQFTGGRQRQNPRLRGKTLAVFNRGFQHGLDRGNQKRGGFAGAGLSLADQVLAGQGPRQGFSLYRSAVLKAYGGNGLLQAMIQIQVAKTQIRGMTAINSRTVNNGTVTSTGDVVVSSRRRVAVGRIIINGHTVSVSLVFRESEPTAAHNGATRRASFCKASVSEPSVP